MPDYNQLVRLVKEARKVFVSQREDKWFTEEERSAIAKWNDLNSMMQSLINLYEPQYDKLPSPTIEAIEEELVPWKDKQSYLSDIWTAICALRYNPWSSSPDNQWSVIMSDGVAEAGEAAIESFKEDLGELQTEVYRKVSALEKKRNSLSLGKHTKARAIQVANGKAYYAAREAASQTITETMMALPHFLASKQAAEAAHENASKRVRDEMKVLQTKIKAALARKTPIAAKEVLYRRLYQ